MVSAEKDINDIFDKIVLTEETLSKEGYDEGFQQGLSEGNIEGYQLGYAKGAELGAELGEYYGIALVQLKLTKTPHIRAHLAKFKLAIEEFPKTNDPNADIISEVANIRTQFKRLKVLLKLHGESSSTSAKQPDLSF